MKEDIFGLQVAMNELTRVEIRDSGENLEQNAQQRVAVVRLRIERGPQIASIAVLHRDVDIVPIDKRVDIADNVVVDKLGHDRGLATDGEQHRLFLAALKVQLFDS